MTNTKTELIQQAIVLLRAAIKATSTDTAVPKACPIEFFVRAYMERKSKSDFTSGEIWDAYAEAVAMGIVPPLKKAAFLTQLPAAMLRTFGIRKSHGILRAGGRKRGFKGVDFKPFDGDYARFPQLPQL